MNVTIYHNKRCSTSRKGLAILEEMELDIKVRLYLQEPFTREELKLILEELGITAEDLVRKKEKLYKDNFAQKKYTNEEWIDILIENPRLIERPIVSYNGRAVIGRPLEKINEVLGR